MYKWNRGMKSISFNTRTTQLYIHQIKWWPLRFDHKIDMKKYRRNQQTEWSSNSRLRWLKSGVHVHTIKLKILECFCYKVWILFIRSSTLFVPQSENSIWNLFYFEYWIYFAWHLTFQFQVKWDCGCLCHIESFPSHPYMVLAWTHKMELTASTLYNSHYISNEREHTKWTRFNGQII